jgi:hypothetical protein
MNPRGVDMLWILHDVKETKRQNHVGKLTHVKNVHTCRCRIDVRALSLNLDE